MTLTNLTHPKFPPELNDKLTQLDGFTQNFDDQGVLSVDGGGLGDIGSPVIGDLIVGASGGVWDTVSGNTAATQKLLAQTGDGTRSAAPTWVDDIFIDTIRTSGNVGLGLAPSGTVGQMLLAEADGNQQTAIKVTNTSSTGTAAAAAFAGMSDTATVAFQANGSARVVSRWGHAIGGYAEVLGSAGNGLCIGTLVAKPVEIGTNGALGMSLDGTNPHPSFPVSDVAVTTQFNKSNDTTLANITGLTRNVTAGKKYALTATLYTASDVGGGVKFALSGTATMTALIAECLTFDAAVLAAQGRATALGTVMGQVTAVTAAHAKITATFTVNAAGTITIQFAQNASTVANSSVLVGSLMSLREVA